MKRRMLDLFCGRLGWSKAFLARGWEVVGVDLVEPPGIPANFVFLELDVLAIPAVGTTDYTPVPLHYFDFICASSPCEQFSVHCMKFTKKKDHPYPELGITL